MLRRQLERSLGRIVLLAVLMAAGLVSAFYILAMILLCMHLYHGLWSMFQSLGFSHPRYTPRLKKGAAIFAILIAIGNCSIPIAVMAGLVK